MTNTSTAHHTDQQDSHTGAAFMCHKLRQLGSNAAMASNSPKLLVVGCGEGHEAVFLQERLRASVDAIDVELAPGQLEHERVRFKVASAMDLPFSDNHFDLVFYHHVIEHVTHPAQSLEEISRVLKPEGWLFVGTPNRHRLISSVGAHGQRHWAPNVKNKLLDNVHDWTARLTGQFRNECGAHAGFSKAELDAMLATRFARRCWLTREYLRFKYSQSRLDPLVRLSISGPLIHCVAPSIYVMCQRRSSGN